MRRHYKYGSGWDFGFPPFGFRFWGPWGGRTWGFGFPRRGDYLQMLEQYKEELEEMQREIAEELEEVEREIEELKQR
jgi:hypothetical protein